MWVLLGSNDAHESLRELEHDRSRRQDLAAVRRVLGRLELDPFDPTLRTRQFITQPLGHIRATPVGYGEWYVFWQLGEEPGVIEIAQIGEVLL